MEALVPNFTRLSTVSEESNSLSTNSTSQLPPLVPSLSRGNTANKPSVLSGPILLEEDETDLRSDEDDYYTDDDLDDDVTPSVSMRHSLRESRQNSARPGTDGLRSPSRSAGGRARTASIKSGDRRKSNKGGEVDDPTTGPATSSKGPQVFEIDYVGNGTYRQTQLNLFNKRSIEIMKSREGTLSARGLHHRSKDVFVKEVHNATHIITGLMRGERVTSQKYKPSAPLFYPHFQRALANERLGKIDKAIADYTVCVKANSQSAEAFYNRAGLYKAKKEYEKAIADMNRAVKISPANIEYRNTRAQLFRECNYYGEAVKDTVLSKALENQPGLAKTLLESHFGNSGTGDDIRIDGDLIYVAKLAEDPIMISLATPGPQRTSQQLEPIVDFLKGLRFFQSFSNNAAALTTIASKVEMRSYNKDDVIFNEGDPGHHFYIILDGEVSIVKVKKIIEDVYETTVLVKMFRGQTFGETAIESKGGLRTAGAIASQISRLLVLGAEEYQAILSKFRNLLKEEVKLVLKHSAPFHDWEESKLDYLASFAIIKNFGANMEIMKANEPVKDLVVIKSGIVQLIKPIPKPGIMTVKRSNDKTHGLVINEEFDEVPGLWILQKSWNTHLDDELKRQYGPSVEHVDFTVAILGSGQLFGELAALDPNQPSPVAAVTSTAVELYCLESDVLLAAGARYNATTLGALRESLTLNDPPAEKIGYYFRSKYSWELRKDKIITRLKAGKL